MILGTVIRAVNQLSLYRIINVMTMQDIINGRCGWCGTDELYVNYHDKEWGRLVTDDDTLFEFLVLESAQAGLSWITILRKREGYRKAFCNFDAGRVAQMTDEDVERLMRFDGIVRNRLKIKSTITNARLFLAIQKEFGSFYNYTLSFFPEPLGPRIATNSFSRRFKLTLSNACCTKSPVLYCLCMFFTCNIYNLLISINILIITSFPLFIVFITINSFRFFNLYY